MANDLTTFRNHARHMEKREHSDACLRRIIDWSNSYGQWVCFPDETPEPGPRPEKCDGSCIPAKEREQWKMLADEIDAYRRPRATTT